MAYVGKNRGFTLIELLVVVAIIALLISILLPSLSRAREQARTVQCASIQRQHGMANMMYANSEDGHSVPLADLSLGGWPEYRWPGNPKYRTMIGVNQGLTGNARVRYPDGLICPSMPSVFLEGDYGILHSYGRNMTDLYTTALDNGTWPNVPGIHLPSVVGPASSAQMTDCTQELMRAYNAQKTFWDTYGESVGVTDAYHQAAYRHQEALNVLFFDGHVASTSEEEAEPYPGGGNNFGIWSIYQ